MATAKKPRAIKAKALAFNRVREVEMA